MLCLLRQSAQSNPMRQCELRQVCKFQEDNYFLSIVLIKR